MTESGNAVEGHSPRTPLGRDVIVATAVAIADEGGVAKLSMRNLARRLGYEVMSLYNHVANKNELLDLMIDEVAAGIGEPEATEPIPAVRGLAVSTREALLRHPWAPGLWQRHLPGPHRIRTMETLLRLLAESGLSPHLAHVGFHAVSNHVLGHTLQQLELDLPTDDMEAVAAPFLAGLSEQEHPYMIAHVHEHLAGHDGESFELVLDLILDGLVRISDAGQ